MGCQFENYNRIANIKKVKVDYIIIYKFADCKIKMGKTTQSKNIIRLKQIRMILQIELDPNYHDKLLSYLKDKYHPMNSLSTTQAIKRIQSFLKQQLKKQISLLEKYFYQQKEQAQISEQQKNLCDSRLIKLLKIMQHFYKIDDFYQEEDKNLDLFSKLMSLTDNFTLIANLISLLINSQFEKIEKNFFYNIYFICNHLDVYHNQNSSIKQVYTLGETKKDFKFYFILDNQEKQIVILDFYQFIRQNNLATKNYRQVSKFILDKFRISLDSGSMTHQALLFKVKLYLKAVIFQQNGIIRNNANSLVQAVAYGNALYCYIQSFVLNQQIAQNLNIPSIFTFPPEYSDIFRQLLEIFLLQKSDKNAHLVIMKVINEILQIQQKTNSIDIVSRLNDNGSLIYKYLFHAKNYLTNQGSSILTNLKINLEAISDNSFILELFKIMSIQIQETHELNLVACTIVQSIFKKETICTYNDEVIHEAGNLLVAIQYEEQKLMKIIAQQMDVRPCHSRPYLRVLNDLFSKKYHRLIQRRDLAYLARQSSQNCILVKIQDLIKQQIAMNQKNGCKILKRDSFLMQGIQLIGNICQESPTLLQNMQKTNPNIIPYLLQQIEKAYNIPGDITSISDCINFMHHVSLIDGPIRNTMMKRPLISFVSKVLTMNKFGQQLTKNNKNFGSLGGTINRFITNIKSAGKYIFNGFINAALKINDQYKRLSISSDLVKPSKFDIKRFQDYKINISSQKITSIFKCDSKLINLLKIIDKTGDIISKKFNSRSLYMLLKPLLEIAIQRDNVFLDCALQHSLLKVVISQTMKSIKNYNESMQDKQDIQELQKKHLEHARTIREAGNQMLILDERINQVQQNLQNPTIQQINPQAAQQSQRIMEQGVQANQQEVTPVRQPRGQEMQPPSPERRARQTSVNMQRPPASSQMEQGLMQILLQRTLNPIIVDDDNLSEYEQIQQDPNHLKSEMQIQQQKIMDPKIEQKQQRDNYTYLRNFFKSLTWKLTKQYLQNQQVMSIQLISQFYRSFQQLNPILLPLLSRQTSEQNKDTKQRLLKYICQNSFMQTIQKQFIQSVLKKQEKPQVYTFNLVNLIINTYSSKFERMLKYMSFSINLEHQKFNLEEYQDIIENFNNYLLFYLELVAESNSKNITKFIENSEIKYLDTSKMPISRIQSKSLDVQNLRKNLQAELNDKWTLYNVLFDSYLRLISGTFNNLNDNHFLKKPQAFKHFQFLIRTVLKNIQSYLVSTVLPSFKQNISIRQFQQFRQAMKVVMQLFVLNDLRAIQKIKTQSNLLIMFYIYTVDLRQQSIISVLGKLAVEQQKYNKQQQQLYQDTRQNRWKYIKKVFLKMTFYKIKYFLSQTFLEDIQLRQIQQNDKDNIKYERQMKKNYYLFSKIHQTLCKFIQNTFFSKNKNSYVRDLVLFNVSLFGLFCHRIINQKQNIYYNYVFEDNQEKQLTQDQFYKEINLRNSVLLKQILNNMTNAPMLYMPMLLKGIFDVQKPTEITMLTKFNQDLKKMFYQTNSSINQIYSNLTGNNLCFGFAVPRAKSQILNSKKSNQYLSKSEEMNQQSEQPQIDLKIQVLKLNNLLSIAIEFIKYFKSKKSFQQGNVRITVNYIKSIVQFGSFLLSNFEVQLHFPQEGDSLVLTIIRLVEEFNLYKSQKQKFLKADRAAKKKQKHTQNKKKNKKQKKAAQHDKDSISNRSHISQLSQNIPSKSSSKLSKKQQKNEKIKNKDKKSHKRILPSNQPGNQRENLKNNKKNVSKQLPQISLQIDAQPKGSILNRTVTDFLKLSLTVSQDKPFLYPRTAQLIINFLQKFSKDAVIRTQAQIINLKHGKISKKLQKKFYVFGAQLFGDLLKIKVKNDKAEGFFYLISYLAMKLMTQVHVKIDFECAIKRFFYQQQNRSQKGEYKLKNRIKLSQFQGNMVEDTLIDFPDLSYLLQLVQDKKKSQNSLQRRKSSQNKNQQQQRQVIHEFNKQNLKSFQDYPDDSMFIKLKNPNQFDIISLPSLQRKKTSSQFQEDNKKVRFYEYHPEGDFAALICQIISHIIKIIIKEIVNDSQMKDIQTQQQKQKQYLPAFTLKSLLYTLQVLCRQSPIIVPWIARFKCKKILLNELKIYNLTPQSQAYKKIATYIYGSQNQPIQNLQQIDISFLSLLIKFVYPISQISTFLFELCLDNNVLMQDKSQKKEVKQGQQNSHQNKKYVPFGSIIRQKVVQQIQNQIVTSKVFDQQFIKNNFNLSLNNCLIIKKVSSIGLLTILLSIKQLAKLCIQSNMLKKLQEQYLRTSQVVKHFCNPQSNLGLGISSNVSRNFLLNFFIKPIQILQELTVQYQIWKKQPLTKSSAQQFNNNRIYIKFLLTGDTINDQLFTNDIFSKNKFKSEWYYVNGLQGDEPIEQEDGIDRMSRSSVSVDNDEFAGMFDDSESQMGQHLDQQIQQEDLNNGRSIQISGQQLLNQSDNNQDQEGHLQWNGSHDPFDRDSNTFQNFVLYPNDDHVIQDDISDDQNQIDQEEGSLGDDSLDDIDENQIDQYDDDSDDDDQGDIDIQISQSQGGNILFPIQQSSISLREHHQWPFGQGFQRKKSGPTRIVPQVGIYYYFCPPQPQRRQHPHHVCPHSTKPQIKQVENLYQIFMDVVSFEHIIITNNMVKLQNQQAKMIRKVFKVLAYKNIKGTISLYKQHILKLQQQYYDEIYKIFNLDSMLSVCQAVDFKHCDKMSHFLQTIPTHFIDQYMDQPDVYFNEVTKPLRARRRGIFLNQHLADRIRRDNSNYRNALDHLPHRIIARPSRFVPNRVALNRQEPQSYSSSRPIRNEEVEENPIQAQEENQEEENNQVMHRIQFNFQNPNGGVINFHSSLERVLQNMGMSEREFLNLPQEVQSDIIQNSISNQMLQQNGNLNQIMGRFMEGGHQAPNVSPVLQPHQQQMQQQQSHQGQINEGSEANQITPPQSFDMQEQGDHQSEGNPSESDSQLPQILNINENNQQNRQNDQQSGQQMVNVRPAARRRNRMQQGSQNSDSSSQTPIRDIDEQDNPEELGLPQRYRKISLQHSQKISKDIIQILNKDHKNDAKFPQISQQMLQQLMELIYNLQNKDFSRFPYSLLSMNMINSKSCSKILSTIMTLLGLYSNDQKINSFIQDRKYGEEQIKSKRNNKDLIPKLGLRTYLYEISTDYVNDIYPTISIKLLHILQNLTKSYSISMQMLKFNNCPLKVLQKYQNSESKQQKYLSSFQKLFRMLGPSLIKQNPVLVQQILRILNNIVTHYFEKNIFSIHQQQKESKKINSSKNQNSQNKEDKQNKMEVQKPQQISMLPVSIEKSEQTFMGPDSHKAIQLQQQSIQYLCSMLMSDELRQSGNLSQLIMKLSINGKNLLLIIKNIQSVLQKLCQKSISFLVKQKHQIQISQQSQNYINQLQQTELEDLMKVYCLLEIFSSMIKQFKQFAYRHHVDRYDFIMSKFKAIIQSKSLYNLCESIAAIISNTGQKNDLIKNVPQIFEIFFIVFSINMELVSKNGQEDKDVLQQKQANKIASLGEINQKHKKNANKIVQQSIVTPGNYIIQNIAFNKLWNQKVCSANGRILLNSTIKRKLSTILKRKSQLKNMSLFDIPMIKIVINSPHLLDFENKRALFRAQMKRIKKRGSSQRTLYMSLDRKQVFQQSFGIIMDKKPQELKNRVKIDFEGQQGQDAGGLTRQWYQLLSTQMFNPNYGLFKPSSTGNTYQPSSTSYVNSEHLNYFKFIGRIMGKALFDGYMLDAYFTPAFYKHILKIPITYQDMQQEDYEYFNSLKWILSNSPIEDYMDLDFTYEFDNFGQLKTKELIPNGQNVKVTQQNKFRYVQLICYAKMATAVQAQLQKFLQGLHQIVPHKYMKIFDPKELQMMISGLPTIDIVDLKRNTELLSYVKTDQIIIWLFEVLESFDMSLRTSFLQFVTGTSRVPPEGFKGLNGYNGPQKFTIQKQFDIKKLPRAHTCFNTLDLPPYPTKQMLIQKLTYAITQGKEGFGMV